TILSAEGKYEEAEKVHSEALALQKKLWGEEHPMVAVSLGNLALALRKEGNLSAAEAVNHQALALRIKILGEEHPDTSLSLENLATVLCDEHRYAEAEPLLRQCLAIREKKFPNSWRTSVAQSLLGGCLLSQKNYDSAEPLLVSAYEGLKQRREKIPFEQ